MILNLNANFARYYKNLKLSQSYDTNLYLLMFFAMLYITCKLTCNPLFFRQVWVTIPLFNYSYKSTSSAFLYPAIYVISDAMTALFSRKVVIKIILFGILCDGISSYLLTIISAIDTPSSLSNSELANTKAVNILGSQMWFLFYHGIIATIIASISEIIIFSNIYKKLNSFFISTFISISLVLCIHDLITDYSYFENDPDGLKIIFHNWASATVIIVIYTLLIIAFMKIAKIKYMRNK